jgi:ribosomal protein L37AE/L43A
MKNIDECRSTPRCPWCGRLKSVREADSNHHHWYCSICNREFEDIEDGDIGYGSPENYAERAERRQQRKVIRR